VHTKVGVSPAHVLSQLSTAIAGAACFVASIAYINSAKTALFEPVFTFYPASYSWLGSLSIDLDREIKFPESVQVPKLEALVPTDVNVELKKISKLEARAKLDRKKTWTHLARLVRAKPAKLALAPVIHPVTDAVNVSSAAPLPLMSEAEKMQAVHTALVAQFRLSMNDLRPLPMTTQLAEAPSTHAPVSVISEKKSSQDQIHLISASEETLPEAPVEAPVDAKSDGLGAKMDHLVDKSAGLEDFKVPPGADEHAIRTFPVAFNQVEHLAPEPEKPTIQSQPQTITPFQVQTKVEAEAPPQAAPAKQPEPTPTQAPLSETVTLNGTTIILPPVVPISPEYSQPKPTAIPFEYSVKTPPPIAPSSPKITQRDVNTNTHLAVSTQRSPGTPSLNPALIKLPLEASPQVSFVEAFDWGHPVADAQTEILTREDSIENTGLSRQGWRIAHSAEHWPTLFWNQSGEVPMLLKNSAKMLSLKTGASIQSEAGIVIAKCPAGWSLEFSGRSEHALVFSEGNQLLANDSPNEERFYVYLNASPGAQIVYLVKSGETGAVTLPVFGNTLSYADLTQFEKKPIVGKVLDSSGASTQGLTGVQVQIIGSGQTAVTNTQGVFRFENVLTFGNQPLFVEAESNRGYPHRYKVNPKAGKLPLFFMSEEQVHDWVGQLDGGISTESGLIVGALPSLASVNEALKPVPSIKSLAVDPTLSPETYTVSGSGQLLVKTPLSEANSRLLGVQVPEGPALIQLSDKDGKVLWSELLVVSPRVLSVVGPY
jgi:hypothetical protein